MSLLLSIYLKGDTGAACWYHHRHKAPSQGMQDPPCRRASMTTPP